MLPVQFFPAFCYFLKLFEKNNDLLLLGTTCSKLFSQAKNRGQYGVHNMEYFLRIKN